MKTSVHVMTALKSDFAEEWGGLTNNPAIFVGLPTYNFEAKAASEKGNLGLGAAAAPSTSSGSGSGPRQKDEP